MAILLSKPCKNKSFFYLLFIISLLHSLLKSSLEVGAFSLGGVEHLGGKERISDNVFWEQLRSRQCETLLLSRCSANTLVSSGGGEDSLPPIRRSRHNVWSLATSLASFLRGALRSFPALDREIFSIALPALATLAIDPLMSMVDAGFVGRLGAAELGGLGAAAALLKFFFAAFGFLQALAVPLVAEAFSDSKVPSEYPDSETKEERTAKVISEVAALAISMGMFSAAALWVATPALVGALVGDGSPTLAAAAVSYLRVRCWAAPAVVLGNVLGGAFRGTEDLRSPLILAMAVNLANLAGDYFLVLRLGMGVRGAALATGLSQILSAVVSLGILLQRGLFSWQQFFKIPNQSMIKEVLLGSVWSIRSISILSTFTLASSFATRIGDVAGAVHEMIRQVWMFEAMGLDSLAVAAQIMIAKALGSGRPDRARAVGVRLLQLGLLCGIFLGGLTQLAAPFLPLIFTNDVGSDLEMTFRAVLPLMTLFQPVNALVFVYDGIAAASKDYEYSARSVFCAGSFAWLVMWSLKLHTDLKLVGVWIGINALMFGRALALGARFLSRKGPIPPYDDHETI